MKLREYERDVELLGSVGDERLAPPPEEQVLALVRERMVHGEAPPVRAVELVYLRWKPRTALAALYRVTFDDDDSTLLTLKTYSTGKAEHLAQHAPLGEHVDRALSRLRPVLLLADQGRCWLGFPVDRVLRGTARLLNARRTARLLEECGAFAERTLRRRRTRFELLRYKPERRAVFRVDLSQRGTDGDGKRRLAARVLPPGEAERVAERRRASTIEEAGIGPALVGTDPKASVLFEEWIEGRVPAPDTFEHAAAMGRRLAALHSRHATVGQVARSLEPLRALYAVDPLLAQRAAPLASAPIHARAWIHGDLHPDQLIFEADDRSRLLDLDALRPGDPVEDLASWVADHLVEDEHRSLEDAAGLLLDAYHTAGAERVARVDLSVQVSDALAHRAAAAIRRLEKGAPEKARRLIERARELASPEARA